MQVRFGLAVHLESKESGWDVAGGIRSVGAAIASGRLLNLEPTQLSSALGLAVSQVARMGEPPGFVAEAFRVGQDGANGVLDAILAGKGFDASDTILDEREVAIPANWSAQQIERLTDALGQRWDSAGEDTDSAAEEAEVDQALRARVHELVWPYLPRWKEQRLFELVDSLPELEDVGAIAELLQPVEDGES
jgi:hypothetical protein